jgi:hypothetical protein
MSKRELIDAIRTHNRTVSPEFLARFAECDLEAYLDRVSVVAPAKVRARIGVTQLAREPGRMVTLLARQPLVLG